jgi:NAD(P)-dependent dehydrogenase (short-subunit alcohol dehydrogenase family)
VASSSVPDFSLISEKYRGDLTTRHELRLAFEISTTRRTPTGKQTFHINHLDNLSNMSPRIFFITGTSTGFGLEYVKVLLKNGDYVVATARDSSKLKFEGASDENCLLVDLDVTSQTSIDKAFDAGLKKFGRVDVVCNNAGYGLSGEFESLSDKQIRTQMEVNFFGLIDVTRKAMQVMREQEPKGGVIQQVTSIGGQIGVPTFSICMYWARQLGLLRSP